MSVLGFRVPHEREKALARVGAIIDEPRFHGHLSGVQNLELNAAVRTFAAPRRAGARTGRPCGPR
jgi:ABC-2 type transport system ATP-binding protein